jgi:hypothetical protein
MQARSIATTNHGFFGHEKTRKKDQVGLGLNPQSVPNGSYRVISCLFVAKLPGSARNHSVMFPSNLSLGARHGLRDNRRR